MLGSEPLESSSYRGEQTGWYLQGVYQFKPRWRIGYRHDQLQADNRSVDLDVLTEAGLDDEGHTPARTTCHGGSFTVTEKTAAAESRTIDCACTAPEATRCATVCPTQ